MLYILSQILICLAYVFCGITFIIKSRIKILIFNFISTTCFCLSYLCLFAWSGVAMNLVSLLRNVVFFSITKYTANSLHSKAWDIFGFVFIMIVIASCSIFTYNGFLSLMPVFASLLYTYAIWQKNNYVFKIIAISNSALWIAYNAYVSSIMGVILESVMIVCGIVGFVRLVKSEKLKGNIKDGDNENGISEAGESR